VENWNLGEGGIYIRSKGSAGKEQSERESRN
jgi:hypothetical protein